MSYALFLFSGFYKGFLKTGHKFYKFVSDFTVPLISDKVNLGHLTNWKIKYLCQQQNLKLFENASFAERIFSQNLGFLILFTTLQ